MYTGVACVHTGVAVSSSSSLYAGRETATQFRSVSIPAGFRRHLIGETTRNVCHCDTAQMSFSVSPSVL